MESLNIFKSDKSFFILPKSGTGFTLIEITLVIALIIIIFGFGLTISFDSFRKNYLKTERDTLISVLQKARGEAINNVNDTQHGFYFDGTDYVLFEGSSSPGTQELKITKNPSITISGLTEVVFEQLSGDANSVGDIILSDGINPAVTININQEGRINW
jgi:Tfp pilus assembly protein FimT